MKWSVVFSKRRWSIKLKYSLSVVICSKVTIESIFCGGSVSNQEQQDLFCGTIEFHTLLRQAQKPPQGKSLWPARFFERALQRTNLQLNFYFTAFNCSGSRGKVGPVGNSVFW